MATANLPPFRDKAIKHYLQGREKDVLPLFVAPSAFALLWTFVGFLIVAGSMAWIGRAPIYATGSGFIIHSTNRPGKADNQAIAVIFFAPDQLTKLRSGQSARLQIGSNGPFLSQTITKVEPTIMNPAQARQQFQLDKSTSFLITQPSAVAFIRLSSNVSANTYAGSFLHAEVEVGSQSIIALLLKAM